MITYFEGKTEKAEGKAAMKCIVCRKQEKKGAKTERAFYVSEKACLLSFYLVNGIILNDVVSNDTLHDTFSPFLPFLIVASMLASLH